jgi:hypothetical protein
VRSKGAVHRKNRFLMNALIEAKKPPEVKPGVRGVFQRLHRRAPELKAA